MVEASTSEILMLGMFSNMNMMDTYECDMSGVLCVSTGDECIFHSSTPHPPSSSMLYACHVKMTETKKFIHHHRDQR